MSPREEAFACAVSGVLGKNQIVQPTLTLSKRRTLNLVGVTSVPTGLASSTIAAYSLTGPPSKPVLPAEAKYMVILEPKKGGRVFVQVLKIRNDGVTARRRGQKEWYRNNG